MQALVYLGPGQSALQERPKPQITAPTDAIVKVSKTTLCGTDLHILKGDVPSCQPGRILGHEGVGIVDQVGAAVTAFKSGDRVLPTGFECGVLNGKVQPGSTVAIVGAGPIGLAALLTAQFYSPAGIIMIDLDDNRLEVAKRFGATATINSADGKAVGTVMKMTGDCGVDTAIEAVGIPTTFELCESIVAPGGTIANIGVHGTKVSLHLENLWNRNITITTRLVDTVSTPMLLNTVLSRKIDPKLLITHRFNLDRIRDAYETFAHAANTRALKVIIEV